MAPVLVRFWLIWGSPNIPNIHTPICGSSDQIRYAKDPIESMTRKYDIIVTPSCAGIRSARAMEDRRVRIGTFIKYSARAICGSSLIKNNVGK